MSQHKSLKSNSNVKARSVKKRWERLQTLIAKGKIIKSVFGLPKEKVIRFKVKAGKEDEKKEETFAEVAERIIKEKNAKK